MKKRNKITLTILSFTITLATISLTAKIAASSYNDWTMINGIKYFYNSLGNQIGTANAKKVIDISEHQGVINWNAVKNQNTGASSIDGAIIRLSAGTGREDYQLANNISGARANGIPIGAYIYSYAATAEHAEEEARFTAAMIEKYGLQNTQFPIYYDLEHFGSWNDGVNNIYAPTSVEQYRTIINTYINYLHNRGYYNVQVYSYRALIQSYMNVPDLLQYIGWIAEYNHVLNFDNVYYNGLFGWQYTSTAERVNGISGNVDTSCFYYKEEISNVPENIGDVLKTQGLSYGNNYVAGFTPKTDQQAKNAQILQNLNNDQYNVVLTDSAGNPIDYNSGTVALATGNLITFKRKNSSDTSLSEYQFVVAVKSDVNGNGKTDAADYLMIMDNILSKFTMNDSQRKAGDVNGNGKIDAADYLMIMDNILGKYDIS